MTMLWFIQRNSINRLQHKFRHFHSLTLQILHRHLHQTQPITTITSKMDHHHKHPPAPTGTILFTSVGRPYYGFDIFSLSLTSPAATPHLLTDGISVNFNGHFLDEDNQTLLHISERTGSARIHLTRPGSTTLLTIPTSPKSLFHDRPVVKNGKLYFVSAHEEPDKPFRSWSGLYSTRFGSGEKGNNLIRLTPSESSDFSPAVSESGEFIAVASYGSGRWGGEFHDLKTDIIVFNESDPGKRVVVAEHGGWPTFSGDSRLYFHRQSDDGWLSVYGVDLPDNFDSDSTTAPFRVTPPGVHCFTPAAMGNSSRIVLATRRKGKKYRHIEIFDTETKEFTPVTEPISPDFHHYNPFVSPGSKFVGYHRFRGEGAPGECRIPHLQPVDSPIGEVKMLRLNGSFPAFSPCGKYIAMNLDFDVDIGIKIVKSDGSKRWTLVEDRAAFGNSWSPDDGNVVFTSIGPIFQSAKHTVQLARVTFDQSELTNDRDKIGSEIKILTKEETGNNAFPSCSPDGKYLVFRSGRSGYKNLYVVDAVNGEFENGMIRQLTEGPWIDTMPSWSPDGKLIAFSSNRHNPSNTESFGIYVVQPDGSGVRRIRVAGFEEERERLNHVCFSADGEWLLFTANLGGVTAEPVSLPNHFQPYGDLYVVRLDGSGLQRLTWNGYENGTPAWCAKALEVDSEALLKLSGLSLEGNQSGEDELKGQFEEPLWIQCDF